MAGRRTPTPQAGIYPIDSGTCRIIRDADGHGWLIEINGVQSSHIDLDDPLRLEFEYMRQMVAVIEARHTSAEPLRVLHLGAGACTVARYLIARFPQSRQVAVDIDAALATLMREQFDLPRAPLLRIRVGDARSVVESLSDHSRDIIIRDVFAGALTPTPLTTAEFTEHVRRVLRPGGMYLLNCADTRDLCSARSEISTVADQFASVAMIADPAMFKGRRYGNLVVVATDGELSADPGLIKELLAGAVPAQMRLDAREFAAGMPVLRDQN